ncbi:MAG: rod shape-determining protein MreC [Armatimonadetes bacterium]|nr:rod shape-determining protein MreC [Armatimonadota bacterium]
MIILGFGIGTFQNRARAQGRLDPVSNLVQSLLLPASSRIDSFFDASSDFASGVRDAKSLREENQRLKDQLHAVNQYMESSERFAVELDRLRKTVHLDPKGRTAVYADVIGHVPYDNRITISAGADKGLKQNLAVVTVDGLLGVISTVDEKSSQVILITSKSVQIGGLVQSDGQNIPGMVHGIGPRRLSMDLPAGSIAPGSDVITTGYSENIPRGIKVGTVTEFFEDEQFGEYRATILPSAKLGLGTEVAVLK